MTKCERTVRGIVLVGSGELGRKRLDRRQVEHHSLQLVLALAPPKREIGHVFGAQSGIQLGLQSLQTWRDEKGNSSEFVNENEQVTARTVTINDQKVSHGSH